MGTLTVTVLSHLILLGVRAFVAYCVWNVAARELTCWRSRNPGVYIGLSPEGQQLVFETIEAFDTYQMEYPFKANADYRDYLLSLLNEFPPKTPQCYRPHFRGLFFSLSHGTLITDYPKESHMEHLLELVNTGVIVLVLFVLLIVSIIRKSLRRMDEVNAARKAYHDAEWAFAEWRLGHPGAYVDETGEGVRLYVAAVIAHENYRRLEPSVSDDAHREAWLGYVNLALSPIKHAR